MRLLRFFITFFPIFLFSQNTYFISIIDKFDSSYPKENERFFWIIDASDKKPTICPLYFFTVDDEMNELCKKNNSIGIFNRLENTLQEKELSNILDKIYRNKKLIFSVNKKFVNGNRKIKYNVYITKIETEKLFSCNIDIDDGNKINYQGKVFFLNKDFRVDNAVQKNDLNKLEPLYFLNLNYIKTNPYEFIRFK